MAYDMTKCLGGDCPWREKCYRFTSETVGRQDFFAAIPYDEGKHRCTEFWDNTEQIKAKAYEIWLREGRPKGLDVVHWELAKIEILEALKK
ncbi:MAG: DUF2934 domain-containing protein [Microscillaceae bacterium]|nr:DUF2934 domain-containing protein [Microscillaceae bacterium]